MRNFVAVRAVLGLVVLAGCGGSSSHAVTCGPGTHDDGSGTCILDATRAIENTSGNYWQCNQNSLGYLQFFSDGTGNFHHSNPPGIQAITWHQTAGQTDGITFTAGAANHTLSAIRPNAVAGPVQFTANYDTSYPTSCSLVNGTMP